MEKNTYEKLKDGDDVSINKIKVAHATTIVGGLIMLAQDDIPTQTENIHKLRHSFRQSIAIDLRSILTGDIMKNFVARKEGDPEDEKPYFQAITILKNIQPKDRSISDIHLMKKQFSYIKVFDNIDESGANECFRNQKQELLPLRKVIFHFGSMGNRFYIVLEGEVEIWVPGYSTTNQIDACEYKRVAILGQGSSFGEYALLSNSVRRATIVCKSNVVMGTLTKGVYVANQKAHELRRFQRKKKTLSDNALLKYIFHDSTDEFFGKMVLDFKPIHYKRKSYVYKQDDKPKAFYIVRKGLFKIISRIKVYDKKQAISNLMRKEKLFEKERDLQILGEGECFGEYEQVNGGKRQYDIVCSSENGVLIHIDTVAFEGYFMNYKSTRSSIKAFAEFRDTNLKSKIENVEKNLPSNYQVDNFFTQKRLQVNIPESFEKSEAKGTELTADKKELFEKIINLEDLLDGRGIKKRLNIQDNMEKILKENVQSANPMQPMDYQNCKQTQSNLYDDRNVSPEKPVMETKSQNKQDFNFGPNEAREMRERQKNNNKTHTNLVNGDRSRSPTLDPMNALDKASIENIHNFEDKVDGNNYDQGDDMLECDGPVNKPLRVGKSKSNSVTSLASPGYHIKKNIIDGSREKKHKISHNENKVKKRIMIDTDPPTNQSNLDIIRNQVKVQTESSNIDTLSKNKFNVKSSGFLPIIIRTGTPKPQSKIPENLITDSKLKNKYKGKDTEVHFSARRPESEWLEINQDNSNNNAYIKTKLASKAKTLAIIDNNIRESQKSPTHQPKKMRSQTSGIYF